MEKPAFNLLDRENSSKREVDEREGVRTQSKRGQGGEGAQLTGASSGSCACFPKEVQEA